ncbi:hypothetical protein H4R19_000569 [Coemansia spiralis]|nr:hypothetical protein H4R19_000569 [Coemansia spiralis]
MPYINHALSRAHLSDNVQLSIKDINLPVLPEHITCTALTKLSLATPTSMDAVVGFVGKLPRLTSLAIYCCTLVADELDLALPPFGDAAVPPLATKLCHLTFGIDWDNYSPEPAVQAAMFMLLRMRSLVHFIASQVPEQQVLELVRQYNPQYPHLQRIELLL